MEVMIESGLRRSPRFEDGGVGGKVLELVAPLEMGSALRFEVHDDSRRSESRAN